MQIGIRILHQDGTAAAEKKDEDELFLVYKGEYHEGDCIELSADKDVFLVVQLDSCIAESFVYFTGTYIFKIPFGEKKNPYDPASFTGKIHYLHIRIPTNAEKGVRRNLALNTFDAHENCTMFPHASANIETRGEAAFAARNAIDGLIANDLHGGWPWSSWGINKDPKAQMRIDFGRKVSADELVFYLRADFPHDAWWTSGTVHFSDGSDYTAAFVKTAAGQHFSFPAKVIEWLTLDTLIKANDPSPFPALTQLQVFGVEA